MQNHFFFFREKALFVFSPQTNLFSLRFRINIYNAANGLTVIDIESKS